MTSPPTILILDDEVRSLESLQRILGDDFNVLTASTTGEATRLLEGEHVQVILCDQRMPEQSGIEFLKGVRERWPDIIRIILSGYTDPHDIIDGINEVGIFQYVTKPWHPENLYLTLTNACRLYALQRENELLAIELKMTPVAAQRLVSQRRQVAKQAYDLDDGIVRSSGGPMDQVCDLVRQVAPFDVPVLLCGGSGTGKELAARALHYRSLRWNKPFVVENCGALSEQLLESELFGHKRGAFTGAVESHVGLFERANGGTVFLDEIGEVPPSFQVKLLRVLQEGEIRPVGSGKTQTVDVRIVAATNRVLIDEVRAGRFRADLYYRLAGMVVSLPALKDRPGDVRVLARWLVERTASRLGRDAPKVSDEALECLERYGWPGNVRELQNEIQRMMVMAKPGKTLGADLVSRHILMASPAADGEDADDTIDLEGSLKDRLSAIELRIIRETLIRHRWNKSKAARELGLSRVGLRAKLERYGLENVRALPLRRAAGGKG